jgi:hypothetical protein
MAENAPNTCYIGGEQLPKKSMCISMSNKDVDIYRRHYKSIFTLVKKELTANFKKNKLVKEMPDLSLFSFYDRQVEACRAKFYK